MTALLCFASMIWSKRPFSTLCQNESPCKAIHMKICLPCRAVHSGGAGGGGGGGEEKPLTKDCKSCKVKLLKLFTMQLAKQSCCATVQLNSR